MAVGHIATRLIAVVATNAVPTAERFVCRKYTVYCGSTMERSGMGCSSLICRALASAAWPPGSLLILQNGSPPSPPLPANAPPIENGRKNHSVRYMFAY